MEKGFIFFWPEVLRAVIKEKREKSTSAKMKTRERSAVNG